MNDPIRYLEEATYRPYWLKDGVLESTLESVISRRADLEIIAEKLSKASKFFLVGSGGSYCVHHPIWYIAEKYSDLNVKIYSGWEFLDIGPKAVDEDTVCIFTSDSGATKEIIKGLEWANDKGAITISLTRSVKSILGENANYSFGYQGQAVTIGKLTSLYLLFGCILSRMGYPVGKMMLEITKKLHQLLPSMIPQAKESNRPLGINLKDEDQIFVVGGGINWGLTYQFAICTLQEMCWVHATPIDFSEWRHGPIEIFSPGKTAIFLKGRGSQTVNEENIIGWCKENGVNCLVFNSQELDLDNLVTPFTLFVELEWLGYYLSLAKNRDMEIWRYYDSVAF